MTPGLLLPIATDGSVVASLPFFLPAVLIVGWLVVLRIRDRNRDDPPESL